jgi:hypothetical protein
VTRRSRRRRWVVGGRGRRVARENRLVGLLIRLISVLRSLPKRNITPVERSLRVSLRRWSRSKCGSPFRLKPVQVIKAIRRSEMGSTKYPTSHQHSLGTDPRSTAYSLYPTLAKEELATRKQIPDAVEAPSYRMLMRYATTEPKLDTIAHVLEEGCMPTAEPGKGCRVLNKTIWKALDDICL